MIRVLGFIFKNILLLIAIFGIIVFYGSYLPKVHVNENALNVIFDSFDQCDYVTVNTTRGNITSILMYYECEIDDNMNKMFEIFKHYNICIFQNTTIKTTNSISNEERYICKHWL